MAPFTRRFQIPFIPIAAAAIGAAGSIGGGLIGNAAQGKAQDAAQRAYQQSVDDLIAIGVPSVEAQKIALEKYQSQGQYNPDINSTVNLGDSNMTGVSTDPAYKAAQLHALNQLKDIGDSGGMTLTDRANMEKQMSQVQQSQRGAREAIMQKAHERGGYGSGASLAAQLANQQSGDMSANQIGLNTAGMAQDRALQAIAAGGTLGGSLRTQDFGEQEKKAQAQDEIAKWNAANSQSVQGTNVGINNAAQQYNLGNKQNLANSNVDMANKEQTYNQGLQQQNFQNQLTIAQSKANARAGQATNATAAGNANAAMWGNIGSGVNQAATAVGQQMNTQEAADKAAALEAAKKKAPGVQ